LPRLEGFYPALEALDGALEALDFIVEVAHVDVGCDWRRAEPTEVVREEMSGNSRKPVESLVRRAAATGDELT
jgi:hypothetical protein